MHCCQTKSSEQKKKKKSGIQVLQLTGINLNLAYCSLLGEVFMSLMAPQNFFMGSLLSLYTLNLVISKESDWILAKETDMMTLFS